METTMIHSSCIRKVDTGRQFSDKEEDSTKTIEFDGQTFELSAKDYWVPETRDLSGGYWERLYTIK